MAEEPTPAPADRGTMGRLARGAGTNALGIGAKVLYPLLFIAITRIHGPAIAGVFILASTIIDLFSSLAIAGYNDGVLMFLSRYVHDEREGDRAYQVLANALVTVGGVCLLAVLLSRVGGPDLLRAYYPREGLVDAVRTMAPALPFMGLATLAVAATKALEIMTYDALIMGFLRPLLLLVLAAVFSLAVPGLRGLVLAYLLAQVMTAAAAVAAFSRHYSFRRLAAAFGSFRWFAPLPAFALPQCLNMTFTQFVSGMGVLMLGWFGTRPETIAFFATGAEIVRNIRQVRLAFSSAMAPVIARFHQQRRFDELEHAYGVVTRWVMLVAAPAILLVLLFRRDLLLLFHPSYTYDTTFILILVAGPLLNSALGLAGTLVVMTGHSRLNLFNSLAAALVNLGACLLLIPAWGLNGAATASALATATVMGLGVVEARALFGIRLRARLVWKPFAAAACALPLLLAGSPWAAWGGLPLRLGAGAAIILVYGGVLRYVEFEPEDAPLLRPFRRGEA